jgi:hypothetical protein
MSEMKRLLFPGIVVALMLAACQDATRPVGIQKAPSTASASVADASTFAQFLVRADADFDAASAADLSAALAALAGPSAAAASGITECVGVLTGTFDKVEVPPGADCVLVSSTVRQWVKADAGSGLLIGFSDVGGNVMGLSPRYAQVGYDSHVGGNMSVDNAGNLVFASCAVFTNATIDGNVTCNNGNPGSPHILTPSTIGGSVDLVSNTGPFGIRILGSHIGANVHVNNNSGTGLNGVVGNIIANTLVCQNNNLPFVGGPNVAARAQGQCF